MILFKIVGIAVLKNLILLYQFKLYGMVFLNAKLIRYMSAWNFKGNLTREYSLTSIKVFELAVKNVGIQTDWDLVGGMIK